MGGEQAKGATKNVNSFVMCLGSLYDDPTDCSYFMHCRFRQSADAKGGDSFDNDNNDIREKSAGPTQRNWAAFPGAREQTWETWYMVDRKYMEVGLITGIKGV